jgi:hypothetical protein
VTFEECIVRRWLDAEKMRLDSHAASFDLVIEPSLAFLEAGRFSLRLLFTAPLNLVAYDPDARVRIDRGRDLLLLPSATAWRASLRPAIRDWEAVAERVRVLRGPPRERSFSRKPCRYRSERIQREGNEGGSRPQNAQRFRRL